MGGDEEVKEKVEIVGEKQEMTKAGSHGFVNENAHLPNSAYKIPERH